MAAAGVALLLLLLVLFAYGQVRGHEFVSFDDDVYIFDNPNVRSGLSWPGVKWAFTTTHAGNWHPLTWMSHMIDVELFGPDPGMHHVVNVLLHAANALLLFLFVRSATGSLWTGAWVAALFALHPLRVESVAWTSERKDLLSGCFAMLTLLAYVRYVRDRRLARYLLVFASMALGLMAKPMLVTLPAVLLLLDVWPLGRSRLGRDHARVEIEQRPLASLILEKLPLVALSLASSALTLWSQRSGGALASLASMSLAARMANAAESYVAYLWKTVWPVGLAFFYPQDPEVYRGAWSGPTALSLGAFALITVVSVILMIQVKKRPQLTVGWLWYAVTLLPVAGLVTVGNQSMADRYTYLPMIGIYLAVVWTARQWGAGRRPRTLALTAVAAGVVIACTAVTRAQVRHWRNSVALYEHAIRVTDNNYLAHNNLGAQLAHQGNLDAAAEHYARAVQIRPDYAMGQNNLGTIFDRRGDLDRAGLHYGLALRANPSYPEAHNNLGAVLLRQGELDRAADHFEQAIRNRPEYVRPHFNLGQLYELRGDLQRAQQQYERALAIQADHAKARRALARLVERERGVHR